MVLVQNFIAFGFNINYFFISLTIDGDVNIDIQIVHYLLSYVTITVFVIW